MQNNINLIDKLVKLEKTTKGLISNVMLYINESFDQKM